MTGGPARAVRGAQGAPSAVGPRVMFVTAEFAPIVKVGGLGEASAGLVGALREAGLAVEVVLPDYGHYPMEDEVREPLGVPAWVGGAWARHGRVEDQAVTLIEVAGIRRPHPYVDPLTGEGWGDNDHRFFAFSAAVAELIALDRPDLLHLNDWHAAGVAAFAEDLPPMVLTLHNVAHQGWADPGWQALMGSRGPRFEHLGATNALVGGIRSADAVVAVSPSYAREILRPETSNGLWLELAAKGERLTGIRNGITPAEWNPGRDSHLVAPFDASDLSGKRSCRRDLLKMAGLEAQPSPVIGMVARLDHQKGVDLALSLAGMLNAMPARLVLHGSGSPSLARLARRTAGAHRDRISVIDGYDDTTAHRIIAGSDLALVPSRFEPCGLTQMQAMSYGTIPVVTGVGGLVDTVVDLDRDRRRGTGFVAARPDRMSLTDAVRRAVRGWRDPRRRRRAQHRGMTADWSWSDPARRYTQVYRRVMAEARHRWTISASPSPLF